MHNYVVSASHLHLTAKHIDSTIKLNQRIWNVE